MALNIKDPEAHRLATAISELTGQSLTHIVTDALRIRLEQLQRGRKIASFEELLGLARRISSQAPETYLDHAALLYDEHGLPK